VLAVFAAVVEVGRNSVEQEFHVLSELFATEAEVDRNSAALELYGDSPAAAAGQFVDVVDNSGLQMAAEEADSSAVAAAVVVTVDSRVDIDHAAARHVVVVVESGEPRTAVADIRFAAAAVDADSELGLEVRSQWLPPFCEPCLENS